jgi:hypothetical protein
MLIFRKALLRESRFPDYNRVFDRMINLFKINAEVNDDRDHKSDDLILTQFYINIECINN